MSYWGLERYGVVELEKAWRTKRVHLATDWGLIHLGAPAEGKQGL